VIEALSSPSRGTISKILPMLREVRGKKDPMQEVNLLKAICWVVSTWQFNVLVNTLEYYFSQSQVMKNCKEELRGNEVGLWFQSHLPSSIGRVLVCSEIETTTA
jgi:hypothetical protein